MEQKTIEQNREMMEQILLDTQREYTRSNKTKDTIIIILIVCMFLEAVAGFGLFVWYESQFETVTTEQVELYTEGENSNAEYNNVGGDQYNDNSMHNE